jgi:uncharacterized protein (TIGR03437 family)
MFIRNGLGGLLLGLLLTASVARPQSGLTCAASAEVATQRTEGLAERLGDILLTCSGGRPGAALMGDLYLTFNVNVTNKVSGSFFTGIVLAVDTGGGGVPANILVVPGSAKEVVFQGLDFTVPPDGKVGLRVSHVRGDTSQLAPTQPVTAQLSFIPDGATVDNPQLIVGFSKTGLLASFSTGGVPCAGSDLPATITMSNLFTQGTRFFSTRVTEGFTEAFQKADAFSDTGTRIRVVYSDFPPDARLFVPDAVAGSSAVEPTAGGDLGLPASGGLYTVSSAGSLLLIRVLGADANGAGGALAMAPPVSGTTSLDGASEVPLTGGGGSVVYEVVDSNFFVRESAQFPTFLGINSYSNGLVSPQASVSFAPVSTVATASAAPVPRFLDLSPPSDCQAAGDCDAAYFPHLTVSAPDLEFAVPAHSSPQWLSAVEVLNTGAGVLNWTATVTYLSGSGWLDISPASGVDDGSIRLVAHPESLESGTYQATLTVDAGPLTGSRSLPVVLVVTAAVPPPGTTAVPPPPTVTRVSNLPSLLPGTAASTWTAIQGTNLASTTRAWDQSDILGSQLPTQLDGVSVNINGRPAYVYYVSPTQVDVLAPDDAGEGTVPVEVVTPQGRSSSATMVMTRLSPAFFMLSAEGGKYLAAVHTDGTYVGKPNLSAGSVTRPAKPGDFILLFGTGFGQTNPPVPAGQAFPQASPLAISPLVHIGGVQAIVDWAGLVSPGLYQFNVVVPDVPDGDALVEAELEGFRAQSNSYITVQR